MCCLLNIEYELIDVQLSPLPIVDHESILLAHGGGGKLTQNLILDIFYPAFSNKLLDEQHDGAVFPVNEGRLAYITDSYEVNPIFFPGGNIGDLAINGTINDLVCCGAKPLFLTAAFIIEEGFPYKRFEENSYFNEKRG